MKQNIGIVRISLQLVYFLLFKQALTKPRGSNFPDFSGRRIRHSGYRKDKISDYFFFGDSAVKPACENCVHHSKRRTSRRRKNVRRTQALFSSSSFISTKHALPGQGTGWPRVRRATKTKLQIQTPVILTCF